MYKPNTVIVIANDSKQTNKIYTLDVTSKSFYYHFEDFFQLNAGRIWGYLSVIVFAAIILVIRMPQLSTHLYLDDPSGKIKILMLIIGILLGILMFFVLKKKSQNLKIEAYLKKYPDSERITERDKIDEIMNRTQTRAMLIVVGATGAFIWSVFTFRQFWDYHNFGLYLFATSLFIMASAIASLWKNTRFALKLHTEMYATPKVSEKPEPKKHPWEEKEDENEVWKAKMLKIESEINSKKNN